MDKKNTVIYCIAMILSCICAAVWNIHVIVDFIYGFPSILHIICAIVWDIAAVTWILRYLKLKKDPSK